MAREQGVPSGMAATAANGGSTGSAFVSEKGTFTAVDGDGKV